MHEHQHGPLRGWEIGVRVGAVVLGGTVVVVPGRAARKVKKT